MRRRLSLLSIALMLCGCSFAIRGVDEVELALFKKVNKKEVVSRAVARQEVIAKLYCDGVSDTEILRSIKSDTRYDGLSDDDATKLLILAKADAKCVANGKKERGENE